MPNKKINYLQNTLFNKWAFDKAVENTIKQFDYTEDQALSLLREDLNNYECSTAKDWITNWKKLIKGKKSVSRENEKENMPLPGIQYSQVNNIGSIRKSTLNFNSNATSESSVNKQKAEDERKKSPKKFNSNKEEEEEQDGAETELVRAKEDIEEVLLILDNGEEIKNDTQYKLYKWMYDKILKRTSVCPVKPFKIDNNLRRELERTSFDLISRFEDLSVDEICTLKLSLSYVCSTLNTKMKDIFKNAVNNDQIWSEIEKAPVLPEIKNHKIISDIFEKVCKPLKDEASITKSLSIICEERARLLKLETSNDDLSLVVLEILDYVVSNVEAWCKIKKGSEADYILAVYPIINILLRSEQQVTSKSGEITSSVTRDIREYIKQVFDIDSTTATYGRKLDIMIVGSESNTPLSVIEWKKRDVDQTKLLLQQAKNVRVNKCHLSHILKMDLKQNEKKEIMVTGMDWRGFNGYMFGVKKTHNIYSSVLIGRLMIPTHPSLVIDFQESLMLLLKWRKHIVSLANHVSVARLREEVNSSFEGVITTGLKRHGSATNLTYMSPKRRKSVVEASNEEEVEEH